MNFLHLCYPYPSAQLVSLARVVRGISNVSGGGCVSRACGGGGGCCVSSVSASWSLCVSLVLMGAHDGVSSVCVGEEGSGV